MSIAAWFWMFALGLATPARVAAGGLPPGTWLQAQGASELESQVRPARVSFARLDLHGPIDELSIEFQGVGRTRVRAGLLAGERLFAVVPVPMTSSHLASGAKFLVHSREQNLGAAGRAAWAEELDSNGLPLDAARFERERAQRWQALPLELRSRPRPPPGEAVAVLVPSSALYLALATSVLCAGLRKRPLLAGAVCALGAASILFVAPAANSRASKGAITQRCVIEHEYGTGHWLLVRSARGELRLGAHSPLSIESDPLDALVECTLDAREPTDARLQGQAHWTVVGAFDPRGGELQPGVNTLFDLERVWSRGESSQGLGDGWSSARQWLHQAAAPTELEAEEKSPSPSAGDPPPGWLIRGLPLGRSALVGKLRAGPGLDQLLAQAGVLAQGEVSPGTEVWLRVLGWPQ